MLKEYEGERERGDAGISREGLSVWIGRHMLPAQRCRTAPGSKGLDASRPTMGLLAAPRRRDWVVLRYSELINCLSDVQSSLLDLIDHALPFDNVSFPLKRTPRDNIGGIVPSKSTFHLPST